MLRFVPSAVDTAAAAELLDEYFASRAEGMTGYVIRRPEPAVFTPPSGVFLVAEVDDRPVGAGGVRMLDGDRGEIKHLWVRPAARGTGLGRELLTALEREATGLGATQIVLDTNARLEAAQGLYRSTGYHEVDPYNDNPNATHWFAKTLAGDPGQ